MLVAVLAFHAACTDTESATNLNPAGPPMIEQVIMTEGVIDASGGENDARVFAFGTLPGVDPAMEHSVTSAAVATQRMRIVFDEILRGNRLEEIGCNGVVGPDGAYDRVPDGATPDDVAKCAVAQDVLPSSCVGDHAMCLCQLDAGCLVGSDIVAKGKPVGVQDVNQDGAADSHRFIPTSVMLKCGSTMINADPAKSYWYPSGDQLPPAMGGVEAIGPAVVWLPASPIPTNTMCQLAFDPTVVDKTDIQVCAPPGGRTPACSGNLDLCSQNCTPGDVSAFSFTTAPLALAPTFDLMGADKTQPLILVANAAVDPASLTAALTMTQAGQPFSAFTVKVDSTGGRSLITISATAGTWQASTMYTIKFSTALKDVAGSPLPAPITISFTTGA